jgi:glycosyltransferase involved in cell wall biosynthesis
MTSNQSITLLLPAYNEELTIADTIKSFHKIEPSMTFIVIDNNSTDRTFELATKTISSLQCKGKIILEPRQGKGWAIRTGFNYADTDIVIMVDADSTYQPNNLKELIDIIKNGNADMVIGDRLSMGQYESVNPRRFHSLGNWLVTYLINKIFSTDLNDIMSGYRLFTRAFIKNFPVLSTGFEIETEMTLHALDKKFRIVEKPIPFKERPTGSVSKLNTFRDGFRVIRTILLLVKDFKPLLFFSLVSFILGFSGLMVGMPVITEFISTQYIRHVPLAILATGLMIVALVFLSIGIILDTIVKHHRFNYELNLLKKEHN